MKQQTAEETSKGIRLNEHVTVFPPKESPKRQKFLTTRAPATFDKVAVVSALLGALIGGGAITSISVPSAGIYSAAVGTFHLLEFIVTARYNRSSLGMWSFLLTNGIEYALAQLIAVSEYLIRWRINGQAPTPSSIMLVLALVAIILGQVVRTSAMIQAAQSFNHYVQEEKHEDHALVRSGLYSIVRHPSYLGYFLWAIGTQLALGNKVSLILFAVTLTYYFYQRVKIEEAALIKFFGNEYLEYKQQVWSGVLFYP